MSNVKLIKGKFDKFTQALRANNYITQNLPDDYFVDMLKVANMSNNDQIIADLERISFLGDNPAEVKSYIRSILARNECKKTYMQGQLDSSLIALTLLFNKFGFDHLASKTNKFYKINQFAFHDDAGVPCGLCFLQISEEPKLWNIVLTKNTFAPPEEREVVVLCHSDFMDFKKTDHIISSTAGYEDFLKEINSKKVEDLIRPVLRDIRSYSKTGLWISSFIAMSSIILSTGLILGISGALIPLGILLTGPLLYIAIPSVVVLILLSIVMLSFMYNESSLHNEVPVLKTEEFPSEKLENEGRLMHGSDYKEVMKPDDVKPKETPHFPPPVGSDKEPRLVNPLEEEHKGDLEMSLIDKRSSLL